MNEYSILVVDDEEDTVELARMVLEYEGYRVFSASNGEEAINFLETNAEKPDLVLLDVLMPKLDGLEVCRWIKKNKDFRDVPVLMFTAKVGKKDRMAGEEAGADGEPISGAGALDLIADAGRDRDEDADDSDFAFDDFDSEPEDDDLDDDFDDDDDDLDDDLDDLDDDDDL